MKLEQQVTSLELSKRLKELGVKQKSLFWWIRGEMEYGYEGEWHINETKEDVFFLFDHEVGKDSFADDELRPDICDIGTDDEQYNKWKKQQESGLRRMRKNMYSAFTVAELGEMLKESADTDGISWTEEEDGDGTWKCQTIGTVKNPMGLIWHEKTEADARAKMLIYLIENNLLK